MSGADEGQSRARSGLRFNELREIEERQRQEAADRTERDRVLKLVAEAEQQKQAVQASRQLTALFITKMQERQAKQDAQEAQRPYAALRQSEKDSRAAAEKQRQDAATREKADRDAATAREKATRDASAAKAVEDQKTAAAAKAAETRTRQEQEVKDRQSREAMEQSAATAAKAEQDRQIKHLQQLAARSWKMTHDNPGPSARAEVQQLYNQEQRRIEEERKKLQAAHSNDMERLRAFDKFSQERGDAIMYPDQHLKGKAPHVIRQLAREGFDAERERDGMKPRGTGLTAKDGLARNDGTVLMQPERASMDTRGFRQADDRSSARPEQTGEMTDAKQERTERRYRIPLSKVEAFVETSNARAAARGKENHNGGEGRTL